MGVRAKTQEEEKETATTIRLKEAIMRLGKKFVFSTIAIVAISITTILMKYPGDIYLKLVGAIVSVFIASQTISDIKKKEL